MLPVLNDPNLLRVDQLILIWRNRARSECCAGTSKICSTFIGREDVFENRGRVCASLDIICRHIATLGPQVSSLLCCEVARPDLFCCDDIMVGHVKMLSVKIGVGIGSVIIIQ